MENDVLLALMHDTGEASFFVGEEGDVLCFASAGSSTCRENLASAYSGRFLPRGGEDGLSPIDKAAQLTQGELLGYLCRGAVRIPISAPTAGLIGGEWPEAGTLVGAGDVLFIMKTC